MIHRVDIERFLRSRVEVLNEDGGRGYDRGVRVYRCPLCGDDRGRGWLNVESWAVGCFNGGCRAEPTLDGGAVELARELLRLRSRAQAAHVLKSEWSGAAVRYATPRREVVGDWVRWPEGSREFSTALPALLQTRFERFVESQWGIGVADAQRWGLRWTVTGPHAWRVVVPVVMRGVPVGFQTRTVRGAEPRYLVSRHGAADDPAAECGRPAAEMLFNVDAVAAGGDALLVEGPGDVMGWHRGGGNASLPAFALLGVALTREKAALIALRAPARVAVALDPDQVPRAAAHAQALRSWGVRAVVGAWEGAKDAGAGASLAVDWGP